MLVERARTSIEATGEDLDKVDFDRFAERLTYVSGDFTDPATYERIGEAISGAETPAFYLEIPPFLFGRDHGEGDLIHRLGGPPEQPPPFQNTPGHAWWARLARRDGERHPAPERWSGRDPRRFLLRGPVGPPADFHPSSSPDGANARDPRSWYRVDDRHLSTRLSSAADHRVIAPFG